MTAPDAPETIWAIPDMGSDGWGGDPSLPTNWSEGVWDTVMDGSTHETAYRRADLPPTDAQIMADARVEALIDGLERIAQWAQAYPVDVFGEPDMKRVAQVMADAGLTLDSVAASNMRHVVSGVGKIASEALAAMEGR